MAEERWLPVRGFGGLYADLYNISDHGRVLSLGRTGVDSIGRRINKPAKLLKPRHSRKGEYWAVTLYDAQGNASSPILIHRLVLNAFDRIGQPDEMGLHRDDNRNNNHIDNLYWGSNSENSLDQVRNGNHKEARKTQCPQGHAYTPGNTYRRKNGSRDCRTCARDYQRRRRGK